ncbi:PGPGW domain-containing protein [Aeromicrobium sp. CF4.19]|uniref:PGPGW domain-containing protein n=1 Tax=Aeromicrobium sp. CF4.19 TaxID=3373082 RepID=UPI003EE729F7
MRLPLGRKAQHLVLEVLGWILVVLGTAALFLPGPGLLALFAGLTLLSQRYTWAERRVEPVKRKALEAAETGVQSWWRIAGSVLAALTLVGLGIYWGLRPPAPSWWPLRDTWWLLGGWGTGGTLIFSGLVALGLMVYSYRRYRPRV